ncbi:MAG: family 20 glycosylhydrolase [Anaerolineae bacterium]|jgi:hexosaminidase
MPAEMPGILPVPVACVPADGQLQLDAETLILLLPGSGSEAYEAAKLLKGEIARETGLQLEIIRTTRAPRRNNLILLCDNLQAAEAFMGAPVPAEAIAGHGPEAYVVTISPARAIAGGDGLAALRNGVQTLRQIARLQGARWNACHIDDWPVYRYRGVMLDVSRGKVPTLETLQDVVDMLALFKVNVLQLYTEHTFAFASHPEIGLGTDPLTSEDMLTLDAYARARGVELQPNLNCFGHCAHLLSLPEYRHLSETAVPWTLTPVEEGTYSLLGDLLDDLLPPFGSCVLNAGCDETWDLGKGRSAERVAEIGLGRVYLQHLQRLHAMAAARGHRVQFWGDILLHHPELVPELPEDVTLLDWHYEAQQRYPSLRVFAESGRPFWVCPGTSSWNTLFPRIENSNRNIKVLARQGARRGAEGLLLTDWGDHGHYQPLGQSWYGYAYGATQAWSGGETTDEAFDARFGTLWFGDHGDKVVEAIRALGRLNTLEGMPRPNNSNSIVMVLDEPLAGDLWRTVPDETLAEVVAVARAAEGVFRAAQRESRDPLTLEEMALTCRWLEYGAIKVRVTRALRNALASPLNLQRMARAGMHTLRKLARELEPLQADFVRLWRLRARDSEIRIHLEALESLKERFGLAEQWLARIASGELDSLEVAAYRKATPRYEILGQAFWREMRAITGQP